MIDLSPHRVALAERIRVANVLVQETHPASGSSSPIARDTRGLVVLLLFAAYENALTATTRSLLETAAGLRVSARRLQPGFRVFAIASAAESLRAVSEKKLFVKALPNLVGILAGGEPVSTINTDQFPNDGSYMKTSQIKVWADLFGVPSPEKLLLPVWQQIDAIVAQRNGIAHGAQTPAEVGRNYSEAEIKNLISDWGVAWDGFLVEVERLASHRDFYRMPR